MKLTHPRLQMLLALSLSAVMVRGQILPPGPPIVVPAKSPAAVPVKAAATATPTVAGGIKANAPRDMKLLIVAVDGTEPAYAAIKSFIETLGIPYQTAFTVNPSATGAPTLLPLPPLTDAAVSKGYFQGIILTSGNLAYCNAAGTCTAGLTAADWSRLENYARDFGVRLASYYTWPEARYGLAFSKGVATDTIPQTALFAGDSATLFPYLNLSTPVTIANAYIYLATAAPATGETTTPFLTIGGLIAGAINRKADGREYLALTVDNNPYLAHSLELSYGILNWVTKGVFLGGRKVYIAPQVDDLFLANDEYVEGSVACTPVGFVNDPTYDPAGACPTLRITGTDLQALADWQTKWNQEAQFKAFKVAHAFNGFGAADAKGAVLKSDSLVKSVTALKDSFSFLNHTWDHEDLDCFNPAPNAGATTCLAATRDQSVTELSQNSAMGKTLGLPMDTLSMVTPGISGLNNPAFLQAAVEQGIRYLVSDTSKPEYLPAVPNTGIRNALQPSILMIPRRPTNLFYNTTRGVPGVPGSLPDEYNHFYGPNGIFRIGGTGGPAFYPTVQSYADIINRESDNLLGYMLRNEIYPQMYHQSNLFRFSGNSSMFSDLHDAAFSKFSKISNLPVITLTQTAIGQEIERKMGAIAAGVSGVLTPGLNIALTAATGPAAALVTGACGGSSCESYGGQCLSKIAVASGLTTTVSLAGATCSAGVTTVTPSAPAPAGATLSATSATPQVQSQAIATSLTTVLRTVTVAEVSKNLTDALSALTASLDASLWTNGQPNDKKVFDNQKKAAQKVMEGLKKNSDPLAGLSMQSVLDSMATMDANLISAAVATATAVAPASKDLATAKAELDKAGTARDQGKYDEAIDHFGKAWDSVRKVLGN